MADIKISKADDERGLVFGWANIAVRKDGTEVVDSQGDSISPDDLEDGAYLFNLHFRKTGEMHRGEAVGELVESLVVTPDKLEAMGLAKDALPLGWWVGFKVPPEVLAKVKSGDYRMFSIQGRGERTPVAKAATKREADEDFPAAAFAYVPDPETPSTWKLRLWASLAEKETPAQVGMAVAALGPGFRGNKVQIPAEDLASVKAKVKAAWLRVHEDGQALPNVLKGAGEDPLDTFLDRVEIVCGLAAL